MVAKKEEEERKLCREKSHKGKAWVRCFKNKREKEKKEWGKSVMSIHVCHVLKLMCHNIAYAHTHRHTHKDKKITLVPL